MPPSPPAGRGRRLGRRRLTALITAALGVAFAVRFGPALVLALALAAPAAEPWLAPLAAAPAREDVVIDADGVPLAADLYRPRRARGGLVLVHGLSRAGRRHPDLMRVARLLARRGRVVLVPELPGLTAFRLGGREVAEVRAALAELRRRATPIGVAGFSFGAGPALVAAADVPDVTLVGAFGGYADLRHVIAYVTTGVHTLGDRRFVRAPEPYNRWKLLALLVGFVEDARDREQLQAMAERTLAAPSADVADLEGALGVEGRAVLELIRNRREDAVAGLLARLPASARGALDRLSPLAVVPRLRGRLLIAHGTGDDSIPFTESLRLAAAAPDRARVVVLRSFHHAAGAPPAWTVLGARVLDAWDLFRLADELVGWR